MNILLIAPMAPPKNAAEAMQVSRYLAELDKRHRITLVTTPVEDGWIPEDPSLRLQLKNTDVITLSLPLHGVSTRLLATRWLRRLRVPDGDAWLQWKARAVIERLDRRADVRADVIYSRSTPFSSALLGRKLSGRLGVPWLMHLSDPWSDGPYRSMGKVRKRLDEYYERSCFAAADAITLTTAEQRAYYAAKYPECAGKLGVTPNVMPPASQRDDDIRDRLEPKECVHIVHTGAFYGRRRPTPVLLAMQRLAALAPGTASKLQFWFAGNMSPDVAAEIRGCAAINARISGMLPFAETRKLQLSADILLAIEPADDHELLTAIMPSKMADYIAARRPILALTPQGSVSANWCARGYGWSVDPRDPDGCAKLLSSIVEHQVPGESRQLGGLPEPPMELSVEHAARTLEEILTRLAPQAVRR